MKYLHQHRNQVSYDSSFKKILKDAFSKGKDVIKEVIEYASDCNKCSKEELSYIISTIIPVIVYCSRANVLDYMKMAIMKPISLPNLEKHLYELTQVDPITISIDIDSLQKKADATDDTIEKKRYASRIIRYTDYMSYLQSHKVIAPDRLILDTDIDTIKTNINKKRKANGNTKGGKAPKTSQSKTISLMHVETRKVTHFRSYKECMQALNINSNMFYKWLSTEGKIVKGYKIIYK